MKTRTVVISAALTALALQGCALRLDAIGAANLAADGNRQPAAVVVAVNAFGGPVEGLTDSNFQVTAAPLGAGGCQVEITRVVNAFPGRYVIEIAPLTSNAACVWRTGRYGIAVLAQSGSRRGTGVAALDISADGQVAACSDALCSDAIRIKSSSSPVNPGLSGTTLISCDQGYEAVAGGYAFDDPNASNPNFRISRSAPGTGSSGQKQWWVTFANIGPTAANLSTYVVCVKTG